MNRDEFGISGISVFVPPYRVGLQEWCGWTGNAWDKISAVVGHSFRMAGPEDSVYTMAAEAVLKLILDYKVDPQRIGQLALATESSSDNAVGAVIVRGLVDQGLQARGLPPLSRYCEVPEYKQACIAGLGIALMPTFLIESELETRQLVKAYDHTVRSMSSYYLVRPLAKVSYPPVVAFSNWLLEQVREFERERSE